MRLCSVEAPGPLLGAGLDAERIDRFAQVREGDLPYVYSAAESAGLAGLPEATRAFAAAFCCKEALYKALGRPYDWRDCRLLPAESSPLRRPGPWPLQFDEELELSGPLRASAAIGSARVRLVFDHPDECAAVVFTFREP